MICGRTVDDDALDISYEFVKRKERPTVARLRKSLIEQGYALDDADAAARYVGALWSARLRCSWGDRYGI